jgi:LysR family transcriptional regulator, low CO2-responsive transcriptional regulator
MNYTLHQLQIFLKITQSQSITKVAEELYLTQPAISIQLKNFQDQFDIPLTEVIGRKLYITEFGQEIARAAQTILEEAEKIKYQTLAHKGLLTGCLKISVVSTGKYVIPYFLSEFLKKHQAIDVKLDVANKLQVIESLTKNEVDFALVSILPDDLAIEQEALMENKLYLVGNNPTPFAETPCNIQLIETLPLIYREKGSATRRVMEDFITKHQLRVQKKIELTTNEAVKQAIIAGLGVSIMPLIGLKNELINGDLHLYPINEFPIISKWHLIWLSNKRFSSVAEAYLSYIREQKESIINEKFEWFETYSANF